MRTIDGIDAEIARILQENARTSNAEIARQVGLAPSAVFERIRKLEERGAVRGFHADVDPHAVGLPLLAFIFVRSNERAGGVGTAERLARIPEVLEVHHIAGEDCFLVKLRAADTEALIARIAPVRREPVFDLARLMGENLISGTVDARDGIV